MKRAAWMIALLTSLPLSLPRAAATGTAQPLFWTVQVGKGTAYLLGSIHVGTPDMYPLPAAIEKAFDDARALAVEADVASEAAGSMEFLQKAAYPPGETLKDHLSPQTWERVAAKLNESGLPVEMLTPLKPWAAAMMLINGEIAKLGVSAQNGVDRYFLDKARGKKPIVELEGVAQQIALFDSFSEKEQELFLLSTLEESDALSKSLDTLVTAWRRGDAKALEDTLSPLRNNPQFAGLYKRLLDDRNVAMAQKIAARLEAGENLFVVVGAGHLVGPGSVVDILKRRFTVRPGP